METIKVEIYWEGTNYSCGWGAVGFGAIICTNKNVEKLKEEFEDALKSQVEDMASDDEELPSWLAKGEYEICYSLAASALLHQACKITTMEVVSRFSGIDQHLLSRYANSEEIPSEEQRERIVSGLHALGKQLLSFR